MSNLDDLIAKIEELDQERVRRGALDDELSGYYRTCEAMALKLPAMAKALKVAMALARDIRDNWDCECGESMHCRECGAAKVLTEIESLLSEALK